MELNHNSNMQLNAAGVKYGSAKCFTCDHNVVMTLACNISFMVATTSLCQPVLHSASSLTDITSLTFKGWL